MFMLSIVLLLRKIVIKFYNNIDPIKQTEPSDNITDNRYDFKLFLSLFSRGIYLL
jgi:hypothetical protein